MYIDSRYPIRHRLPPGGSGERAGDYIKQGLGLSSLPQRERQRTIYSLYHASSGSDRRSVSVSPLITQSRQLPTIPDYCQPLRNFHEISRARKGPVLTGVGVEKGTKAVISWNFRDSAGPKFSNLQANFSVEVPKKAFSTATGDFTQNPGGRRHPRLPCFYPHSKWATSGPRCMLGFDLKAQVHHYVTDLGCWGCHLSRDLVDQHSKRSLPNKTVDVVACQTFSRSMVFRRLNSCPAFRTRR